MDLRPFGHDVYDDLITRLDDAFEAHAARFHDMDRQTLRLGFATAAAQRCGQIIAEEIPVRAKCGVVAVDNCRVLATAAGIPVVDALPPMRDAPGVN